MKPVDVIETCRRSHRLLLADVEPLTDQDLHVASLLPGYSRGHVLAHILNKTKAHVVVFGGPSAGEVRQLHPDGYDADLAAGLGANRPADDLRADLTEWLERLEVTWGTLPDELWEHQGVMAAGPRSMAEIVGHHLRNVEVHHVDLDIGYQLGDWPESFVEGELAKRLASFADRAAHAEILAWFLGRGPAPGLTGPW